MSAVEVFNGSFNLAQHLPADFAHRCAQHGRGFTRVPFEHGNEIFLREPLLRFQAAAFQQGVGDADARGLSETASYRKFIIALHKGTVNDTENVNAVFLPVKIRQTQSNLLHLTLQTAGGRGIIGALQRIHDGQGMVPFHLPEIHGWRPSGCAGIRHIKNVMQGNRVPAAVQQRNTLETAPHISAHLLIPYFVRRAGRGGRALSVNHELVVVGVFVHSCSGG